MSSSFLDHSIVSGRYFFPRISGFKDPFWVKCTDAELACYYDESFGNAKTIVMFHGNGEVVADYLDLYAPVFSKLGYNFFIAEYRGYGMSSGSPGLVEMLDDVKYIIGSINRPQEKLVLFGRSVGSIYALHAAYLYPNISGLIIESGIADVHERILMRLAPYELGVTHAELEKEVNKYFNHQGKLHKYKGKSLIMHAGMDSLVHCSNGKRLYEWASEPKELRIFRKGDHNDIFFMNYDEYIECLNKFLKTV